MSLYTLRNIFTHVQNEVHRKSNIDNRLLLQLWRALCSQLFSKLSSGKNVNFLNFIKFHLQEHVSKQTKPCVIRGKNQDINTPKNKSYSYSFSFSPNFRKTYSLIKSISAFECFQKEKKTQENESTHFKIHEINYIEISRNLCVSVNLIRTLCLILTKSIGHILKNKRKVKLHFKKIGYFISNNKICTFEFSSKFKRPYKFFIEKNNCNDDIIHVRIKRLMAGRNCIKKNKLSKINYFKNDNNEHHEKNNVKDMTSKSQSQEYDYQDKYVNDYECECEKKNLFDKIISSDQYIRAINIKKKNYKVNTKVKFHLKGRPASYYSKYYKKEIRDLLKSEKIKKEIFIGTNISLPRIKGLEIYRNKNTKIKRNRISSAFPFGRYIKGGKWKDINLRKSHNGLYNDDKLKHKRNEMNKNFNTPNAHENFRIKTEIKMEMKKINKENNIINRDTNQALKIPTIKINKNIFIQNNEKNIKKNLNIQNKIERKKRKRRFIINQPECPYAKREREKYNLVSEILKEINANNFNRDLIIQKEERLKYFGTHL